jgi:polyhydroxybutyrate depolymerase
MTCKLGRIMLIVVVAILLLLCVVAALTYWMVGPSPRCDLATDGPVEAGWSARTVVSGNRERCYHLYVPPKYDPAQPAPVVLSFHGFLSNPNSHALITGWHKLAHEEGFLVVYPQGTSFPQRWNAGAAWGTSDVNDVQFFRDLIDDLSGVAAVDQSRVYVNGFSNGGGMSVRIACEAADRVAAIGSVAGAIVNMDDCSPSRPVPVMAFHGTADPIVSYEGGKMPGHALPRGADLTRAPTNFLGAEEWVAGWAERNGCDPVPETIPPQEDVQGVHYTGCDQGAEPILYTIEEGGHTWPGGMPIPGVGKTTHAIDATKKLWQFFEAYTPEDQP